MPLPKPLLNLSMGFPGLHFNPRGPRTRGGCPETHGRAQTCKPMAKALNQGCLVQSSRHAVSRSLSACFVFLCSSHCVCVSMRVSMCVSVCAHAPVL